MPVSHTDHGSDVTITLIHALASSPPPILDAFRRIWPQARLRSLLDDGLATKLMRLGHLDARMTERFLQLAAYAAADKPDAILFTCSAFGPCIDAVRRALAPLPVRKPSEAMVAAAARRGGRVALIAWFEPTLRYMPSEIPSNVEVIPVLVKGGQAAHEAGDLETHDRLVAKAALAIDADTYALAQFSIARAAPLLAASTDRLVLTTLDTAVADLRAALN